MKRKIKYALRGKLPRKEIKALKFEQNQKQAKPYLLVTSSRFWFEIFKRRPHLYQLHYFLLKVKRIRRGGNELIDILFDKLYAIHDQNFELAAALRDEEKQMEQAFMQKHNINKLLNEYCTVKNGKVNLGIFYAVKQSRKNKNRDATQNNEVQKLLQKIHKDVVIKIDIYDIQPLYEKYKSVWHRQVEITDFERYSELIKFVNEVLKDNICVKAFCLYINDLTVNEMSLPEIGKIIDMVSFLNSTAEMIWGYDRKQPTKDNTNHIELSMLLFYDQK